MKIGSRYWTTNFKISLGEDISLLQCFRVHGGRAVDFSIVLKVKIDGRWYFIKRCDATKKHGGIPHCHIYKLNGRGHIENIGERTANLGVLAKAIIDDIKSNYEAILENFKHSN